MGNLLNETMIEYLSRSEYLSSHTMTDFCKLTPMEFKSKKDSNEIEDKSKTFGTACHMAIQEPELFKDSYFFLDLDKRPLLGNNMNKKENKAWKEEQISSNEGKICIDFYKDLLEIQSRVFGGKKIKLPSGNTFDLKSYFEDSIVENSIYVESIGISNETFDIKSKCRPDFLNLKTRTDFDIKTCKSIKPNMFVKDCWNYGYAHQQVFHHAVIKAHFGVEMSTRYLLAIQNTAPFDFIIYEMPVEMIQAAERDILSSIKDYIKVKESKKYPGYECIEQNGSTMDEIQILPVLSWIEDYQPVKRKL